MKQTANISIGDFVRVNDSKDPLNKFEGKVEGFWGEGKGKHAEVFLTNYPPGKSADDEDVKFSVGQTEMIRLPHLVKINRIGGEVMFEGGDEVTVSDVQSVATSINQTLTDDEIKEVIERYPSEQAEDEGATWNLIVENIIYSVVLSRDKAAKGKKINETYILNEIDEGADEELVENLAIIEYNGNKKDFIESLMKGIRKARQIPEDDKEYKDFVKLDEKFDFKILDNLGPDSTFTTTDGDEDQRIWFLTKAASNYIDERTVDGHSIKINYNKSLDSTNINIVDKNGYPWNIERVPGSVVSALYSMLDKLMHQMVYAANGREVKEALLREKLESKISRDLKISKVSEDLFRAGLAGYGVGLEDASELYSSVLRAEKGYAIPDRDLDMLNDSGFTISQMENYLSKKFPDSFGFRLYMPKDKATLLPDYDTPLVSSLKKGPSPTKVFVDRVCFPTQRKSAETRSRGVNYTVSQGDENTYFRFLLVDDKFNEYIGTFGFKESDVDVDYITRFVAFLHEAYGYPFSVKHTVAADGKKIDANDILSDRAKKYLRDQRKKLKELTEEKLSSYCMDNATDKKNAIKALDKATDISSAVIKKAKEVLAVNDSWCLDDDLDRRRFLNKIFKNVTASATLSFKAANGAEVGGGRTFDSQEDFEKELESYFDAPVDAGDLSTPDSNIAGRTHYNIRLNPTDKELTYMGYWDENLKKGFMVEPTMGGDVVYNVTYFDKDGEQIDQTQIDEKNEELAWELFAEFGHTKEPGIYLEWEEVEDEAANGKKIKGGKVIITVSGGVADVTKAPSDVDVFVVDKDNIDTGHPYKYNGVEYDRAIDAVDAIKADYKTGDRKFAIVSVDGGVAYYELANVTVDIKDYDNEAANGKKIKNTNLGGYSKKSKLPKDFGVWDYIEKNFEGYYSSDDVALSDDLSKYIHGEADEELEESLEEHYGVTNDKEAQEMLADTDRDLFTRAVVDKITDLGGSYEVNFGEKDDQITIKDTRTGNFLTTKDIPHIDDPRVKEEVELFLNVIGDKDYWKNYGTKAAADGIAVGVPKEVEDLHIFNPKTHIAEQIGNITVIKNKRPRSHYASMIKEVYFKGENIPSNWISPTEPVNLIADLGKWAKIHNYNINDVVAVKMKDGGVAADGKKIKGIHSFKKEIEVALHKKYAVYLKDTGFDDTHVKLAMQKNESVDDVVARIGKEYQLTPIAAAGAAVENKNSYSNSQVTKSYLCVIKDEAGKEIGSYSVSYGDDDYVNNFLASAGIKLRAGDKKEIVEVEEEVGQ